MFAEHDPIDDYDDTREERSRPFDFDETICAVVCTSETPEDLASRIQQAMGKYSSESEELHISHAIAPDPETGLMLYSAQVALRALGCG